MESKPRHKAPRTPLSATLPESGLLLPLVALALLIIAAGALR